MTVLVHFSGPSYSKTAVLEPGAAPVDVGRDPQAAIHLPDNDRLISRRHITLEWSEGGAKVSVLSKVNGLTTPRGEFTLGQVVVLGPGDTGQLGRYTLVVEQQAAGAPAPAAALPDPFQMFGAAGAPGPTSVFDDPFFRPAHQPAAPALDTPAALDAMSGKPAHGGAGFSGAAPAGDPLAAFGGAQPPAHSSVSIDDFLGSPSSRPVGLGSAQMLRPQAEESGRRLATDHVHDFNLPVGPMAVNTLPSGPVPLGGVPARADPFGAGPAGADPLAALDAFAAPPQATPQAPAPAPAAAGAAADPWADFASEWVPPGAAPKERMPAFPAAGAAPINRAFDDAFSSSTAWRVEDMPDPAVDPLASASFDNDAVLQKAFSLPGRDVPAAPAAGQDGEAALRALCRGLGIAAPPQLQDKDWEQLGQSIRQIVQGLDDLMNVRAELKKEMRATDRTMLGAQENNPLKSGVPIEELLHYLLFMPHGAAGYMPVKRALDEAITDLRAHEFASLAAVRAVVEGSIREFEPGRLRTTLMKGRRSIAAAIDNARLWDLYTAHYQDKGEHMADWLEQVFNRHFMPAYSRESERLRRESLPPVDPERRS